MTTVLILLLIQGAMGALDTLWHHELGGLPGRASARRELALHAAREAIYAVVFLSLGWVDWTGLFADALALLLLIEVGITLTDFVEEDRTRRLAPTERVLHTLMAIGFGVILAVFAPVLWGWALRPTGLVLVSHGLLAWLTTGLGVGVLVWAVRDGLAVLALGRRPAAHGPVAASGRTVLITGATGFIGAALVEDRLRQGDRVMVLARDILAARARFGPGVLVYDALDQVSGDVRIDSIVNLAGAATVGGPWTKRRQKVLLGSRVAVTQSVLCLLARLDHKPTALISASATGYYGDRGDEPLTEASGPAAGFMSDLCRLWEAEAQKAEALGVRVCRLRLGMVFDWSGGPLPLMGLPARFGLGAVMGSGRQWTPWIARDDVLRLIGVAMADDRYRGPINAVAPQLVTQGQFAHALARSLHRPQWFTAPAWALRLALGEFSDLFLASQRASADRLKALGFVFTKADLETALAIDTAGLATQSPLAETTHASA